MKLTYLKEQIKADYLSEEIKGLKDPFNEKIIENAYLWRDGEETVCDQLTVIYKDDTNETYYGFDTLHVLNNTAFEGDYQMNNGPESQEW